MYISDKVKPVASATAPMDKLMKSLLTRLYAVKVVPASKYTMPTSMETRDSLQSELESLSKKLFETKNESLKLSHSQLLGGILAVRRNEISFALDFFKLSAEYALEAFQQSSSFREKALATRMRVLSALHLSKAGAQHSDELHRSLRRTLDDLAGLPQVARALQSEVSGRRGLLSPSLSHSCLSELASIVHLAEEQAGMEYCLPGATIASADTSSTISSSNSVSDLSLVSSKLRGHSKRVTAMAAGGKWVFSGAKDCTIRVWEAGSLRLRATLRGHTGPITCLAVSGAVLYSGSTDGSVRSWSLSSLAPLASSGSLMAETAVRSLAVDSSRGSVFAGCSDGVIRALDGELLTSRGSVRGHSHWVSCLAVHGLLLCSGSVDATIKLWDTASLMSMGTLLGHSGFITSLAVGGGRLFSGSFDHSLRVWDLATLAEVEVPALRQAAQYKQAGGEVRSLAATANRLYVGDASHTIRVLSLSSGLAEVGRIQPASPTSFDNCLSVCDGKLFVGSAGKTIHVHLV